MDVFTDMPCLNTSFNRIEPMVASPADAVACYLRTGMDVLVLGDFYTSDRGSGSLGQSTGSHQITFG